MASATVLPHNFRPRSYQRAFRDAMKTKRNACLVWHRRAGKDKTVLNFTITKMWERVGAYYYFFPTYAQGKKIIWDGAGKDGYRFMDHFPSEIVKSKNEMDMQVEFTNGSIFQIIGTDKMDSIVGTNPIGCVFSEYAIQNPRAWDLTRPILKENDGWAVFVYTPRGRNHGWDLWQTVNQPVNAHRWYTSLLTVDHTRRDGPGENGKPVFTLQDIEEERHEGMSEALIQQEYYCDFEGAMEGSFYGDLMKRARLEDRVRPFPWDPAYTVDTAWDLGVDDHTCIGFTQTINGYLRWIDYAEDQGKGLEHYWKLLKEKPYVYGRHFAPHDIGVKEWGTGKTRFQQAATLGLHFDVAKKVLVEDGIQAVRRLLPRMMFSLPAAQRLVDAMVSYHRDLDPKLGVYGKPVHDWASNPADMVRYRCLGFEDQKGALSTRALTVFNPIDTFLDEVQTVSTYEKEFNP